jgi:hypothetical protein
MSQLVNIADKDLSEGVSKAKLCAVYIALYECWCGVREMRDPKHFGRDLAERMVIRMRTKKVDAQPALRRVASEVAGIANTMVLAEGKRREEVASWVGEVQTAYARWLQEHLMAAGAEGTRNE